MVEFWSRLLNWATTESRFNIELMMAAPGQPSLKKVTPDSGTFP
jgi:hypothetical protein